MTEVIFRFEDGPFDGVAEKTLSGGTPPEILHVWQCESCDRIHFDSEDPPLGSVRYRFIQKDDRGWLYRYGDPISPKGGDEIREAIVAPMERELVPV